LVKLTVAALPSGSYLVHDDSTDTEAELKEAQQGYDDTGAIPYVLRSPEQLARYFGGPELVEPGIVSCPLWRPEATPFGEPKPTNVYGGVARSNAAAPCGSVRRTIAPPGTMGAWPDAVHARSSLLPPPRPARAVCPPPMAIAAGGCTPGGPPHPLRKR
jgi:hypothetical protein